MRAFLVNKGTEIKVIEEGKDWFHQNFQDFVTSKDNMFFVEDIRIDPAGIVGNGPGNVTVGSHWASRGWYGFERDGWIAMVPGNKVRLDCD